MKRALLVIAATGALGLVAFASLAAGSSRSSQPKTIHLIEHLASPAVVSTGKPGTAGQNRGDDLVVEDPLFEPGSKQVAGYGYLTCVLVNVAAVVFSCHEDFSLPGGHIEAEGIAPQKPKSFVVAITGGTGTYVGARGEAKYTSLSSNPATATKFDWVLTLTP